jgi:thiamine kinase-like enzyme
LLAGFHRAVANFVWPAEVPWCDELADPAGGTIMCHNDVCPENAVYDRGVAVALLDFDFVAPGRPEYDLAQLAKMCVPIDTPEDAARLGRGSLDPFRRLRVVADGYGLPPDRAQFLNVLGEAIEIGGRFVRRRVEAGEQAFIDMWNHMGGQGRYDRRQEWFDNNRQRFLDALG